MSISPQGYTLGGNPENINPFWGEDEETNWTIDAEATIDSSTGSPSVDVDTQTDTTLKKKTFIFNFKHLKGTPGTDGTNGRDGVSPTVTTENIQGGVRVTITDETGVHSFDIMNGTDGRIGIDGDDGYSPTVTTQSIDGGVRVTITDEGGDHIFDIMNGVDGVDGVSPTVSTTPITGGTEVTITDKNGSHTFDVMNGTDGTDNIVEVTSAQYTAMEQAGTLDPDVAYFINDADPEALGTAAFKNYTDTLTPNSTALIESRAVYNAISQTISGIFTPKGNIDFADLTSALLIPANVGNVYETNDAGTTDANWVQGAGVTIPAQSAVAIIQADVIKFNYNGPAVFNLNDYQTKNLTATTQGAATVEGALTNLASQKAEQSELQAVYFGEKYSGASGVTYSKTWTVTKQGIYFIYGIQNPSSVGMDQSISIKVNGTQIIHSVSKDAANVFNPIQCMIMYPLYVGDTVTYEAEGATSDNSYNCWGVFRIGG